MKLELLQYLACPHCQGNLLFESPPQGADEVEDGQLVCGSGCGAYPIDTGVPRLLPELCHAHMDRQQIQRNTGWRFGAQWKMYQYGDTTWGVALDERIQVALHEFGWNESDLHGKVILDAGCGNGTLSAALADRGATVIALDLSDSVFRAHQHCRGPRVHFVQGNLFCPPLKPGVFDAIYSCGVFHHTPDTRRCFDALVPTLKKTPGARYFVWLYSKRLWLFNITVEQLMKLTRRMPSWLLVPTCYALAPLVEVASRALTALRVIENAPRSLRDRAVVLHDLLSPPIVRYHTFEEARQWAEQAGFHSISRTSYDPDEGCSEQRRRILHKYRTVCRPGFGILCRNGDDHPHRERSL